MAKESISESIKEAVQERLSSPLWGYIILSWCGFNWKNVAILFMSKASVNTRIAQIMSHDWFYMKFLFAPLVVGSLLAVASPYLQLGLSVLHGWASKRLRIAEKRNLLDEYDFRKATASRKAEAEYADRLALAAEDLKLEQHNQMIEREKSKAQNLKDEVESMTTKLEGLTTEVKKLENVKQHLLSERSMLQQEVSAIEDLILKLDAGEMNENEFKLEVKSLMNPKSLGQAKNRNKLTGIFKRAGVDAPFVESST
ncbi:TPA: hypothetical protein MYQ36_004910 [Citrobacter braakii]|nr:hypothetical protein [Citrobacter braakii]